MAKFTVQDKINAVLQYLQGEDSYESIAEQVGVSKGVLRTWVKQ